MISSKGEVEIIKAPWNIKCVFVFIVYIVYTRFNIPFYIQSFWLNMLRSNRGCVYVRVCVRVCVCLSVCVCQRYSPNGWTDFDEILHELSIGYKLYSFSRIYEISNKMT